ncbi:DUF87 domain-containing protein [Rhodococcus sp. NJ-530]|uniref:helicase HerA domain-containing protein n=1 Tax=Rhodococcus sp. NJ-530 TaxID=2490853 RepID=UPI000641F2E0|nr:DUF87 domain-containing protein [Rhodococcus sp. NJ-530]AZI65532.1 DUF87 domain-containing protein [Rhodococcus sp. NJ-530]KLN72924.1 hypothetical protein ABM90_03535 [Rhodococcus erythropolis]
MDIGGLAVIGSPSTCDSAVLNLSSRSYHLALLGSMLAFTIVFDNGSEELALGTVTKVETINPVHTANAREAMHVATNGAIEHQSGDSGDTRAVTIKVEAVFRNWDGKWRKHAAVLSNSPATGTPVALLDQQTADELMADTDQPAYIGTLRGSSVRIPFTLPDFSGPRGSRHLAVLGATGSGKSVCFEYVLASQLRWPGMGQIILDPQGQWATEHGLPFSLQGLATACGRTVFVARLSQSLRLRKDAPLFLRLLEESKWFRNLAFGAGADENVAQARDMLHAALQDKKALKAACGTEDWTESAPEAVMTYLLDSLHGILPAGTIYAGTEQQNRVARTIYRPTSDSEGEPIAEHILDRLPPGALDPSGHQKFQQLLAVFSALHSLWSPYSPTGAMKIAAGADPESLGATDRRRDAWGLMRQVMAPKAGQPAPWLVLDLSADLSQLNLDGNDADTTGDVMAATRLLDSAEVKARIMSQLLNTLKLAGQQQFTAGGSLNVQVVVDEAWQYAGPADSTQPDALVSLSNQFAGDCRDVRKFGIGFAFILQSATGLRDDIWRQLAVLLVGYGLHDQSDIKRMAGRVSDSHLALYRAAPPPEATGRYTWMCVGGAVTGLSFGANPVFLESVTDPMAWLNWNDAWITRIRREFSQHLPAGDTGGRLTHLPSRPGYDDPAMEVHARRRAVVDGRASATGVASVADALAGRPQRRDRNSLAHNTTSTWTNRLDDDPPPF